MDKQSFITEYAVDRHNSNSYKWDDLKNRFGKDDLISMWIADMDFKTSNKIIESMIERIKNGVFGYSFLPEEYYTAFSKWMLERHELELDKEWIRFSTGVVTSISWMINAFTQEQDACLILTPVYPPFHNTVTNNNRKLISVDLINNNGYFTMNYEEIEKTIVKNKIKMFIHCSPHNPVGRVWKEKELKKIFDICKKYNVLIISDEIHQDIILKEYKFIPAMLVENGKYNDNLIVLSSASKTFNLAGLIHSHILICNEDLRNKYDNYIKRINRTEVNIIGAIATQIGYENGKEWFENILEVIQDNYEYIKLEFEKKAPKIIISPLEGTYLVFINLQGYIKIENIKDFIQNKCNLAVNYGETFGENFRGFIRLNLATNPKYIKKAVQNILTEIEKLK